MLPAALVPKQTPKARRNSDTETTCPDGGTSDSATVDQLDHVDAALQFMDTSGIDKAAFVGNSMGATSMRFATVRPGRVSRLITVGSPTPGPKLFSAGH
ncbi:alpha/beta fold hydrolase [Rhodococcus sp. KBS0724]|jgi:2-hydroxy-6-oxonona-2,4-dienedioate hydrolase|uniref:alpha/beta fold hydrolase n=1 Tax=Rhodococcus sp. KBS0724 TaxID=1179674 RepID=UPI001C8F8071|nr:alpha/beta fold hydrolase [Rhodococcus sp. KBS0724]